MKDIYTITVMSSSNGSVRNYSISQRFFILLLISALVLISGIGTAIFRATDSKAEIQSAHKINDQLRTKLKHQEGQLRFYERKWEEVRGMVKTVRHVLGLDDEGILGQGGESLGSEEVEEKLSFGSSENSSELSSNDRQADEVNRQVSISEAPQQIDKMKVEVETIYATVMDRFQELDEMPLILPIRLRARKGESYWYSSGFGYRTNPITKRRQFHKGLDIATRSGTPVVATASGTITKIKRGRSGFGNMIRIRHNSTEIETLYAHLKGFAKGMWRGKKVVRGEVIGYVGSTGLSTGAHLHYGIYTKRGAEDPRLYIIDDSTR